MFSKFANFFIQNSKLTSVLVIVTLIAGIGSYIIIPKQYNPNIVVPAFSVMVKAPSLSSDEVKKLVTDELENKIMELEGIDETYGVSGDNYAGVMVKFKVGEDKEKAKIRLNQKIFQNLDLKPLGVEYPVIKTIDPDELPQITYSIYYKGDNSLSNDEQSIYLRQIANILKNKLKTLDKVTTLDIVGGTKKNIVVDLDLDKVEARNADIMEIYDVLKKNNLSSPAGNINLKNGERIFLELDGKVENIEKLRKILVAKIADVPLYLGDVAEIRYGEQRISSYSKYSDKKGSYNAVYLGVGKQVGTNGVFVTNSVKDKMEEIKKTLPSNIGIEVIQDEGKQASDATGTLIKDLIESIIIVVVILIMFLGFKNALNTATSIPLILSLVFLYAYIVGYDINRISLFALILVIGMLVDDSIVVVENIHRHLEERVHTGKTKLDAILAAVGEVGPGVILSTVTKILSFAGMFAVTGMMGEYMGPIPKFAIIALLLSIIIAFSINPWVSFMMTKEVSEDDKNNHTLKKKSKYDIRILYVKLMEFFINAKPEYKKRRKLFKIVFWISLFTVIIAPIYAGIFKARMLPKSNQDQVYLWVDSTRGTNISQILKVEEDIEKFFLKNTSLPEDLNIVKSVSSTLGTPFMGDFANLFRGGIQRNQEFQISSRINLESKEENHDRIKSEEFVIKIRPLLREYLLKKYPDLNIRLLEDPPGPPVRATFMMKLKTESSDVSLNDFTKKVYLEIQKIAGKHELVDYGTSFSTTYKKISIKLDHESISRAGLSVEQILYTLAISKSSLPISLIKDTSSLESTNIILGVKQDQSDTTNLLEKISFTTKDGKKVFLSSIAKIDYSFVSPEINTDKRQQTNYIYAEMGDNSVIYPIIELYSIFQSEEFLQKNNLKFLGWDFYGLHYEGLKDGKKYDIEWDGEWKLTMDTFRDLGTAMIIAILAIYFLIVGQFRSFAVAGIIMLPFLLGFFGIFPGFSLLYLFKNEYFNATSMIGIISLAGIVVGNAILLIDYVGIMKQRGWTIERAIIEAGYIRFMPIMLTSISAIFGAIKITRDPVWSGLARSIVWGLSSSAILTLIAIPIFYYDSQKKIWDECMEKGKGCN